MKEKIVLKIKKVSEDAIMPVQAHDGDLFDCFANKDVIVNSFESTIVPLGISMNIPKGYRVKIFSRSSLPLKKKIVISNGTGIIDQQFTGEIALICHTLPDIEFTNKLIKNNKNSLIVKRKTTGLLVNNPVKIKKGDKIAQFQLEKIEDFEIKEVEELDITNDRCGGFGSTDKDGEVKH